MEKRGAFRHLKSFTTKFYIKNHPQRLYDVSRLLDISRTGLKFFSYDAHGIGEVIVFQIIFPRIYPKVTEIEGEIIGEEQVLAGKTCKVRVKFINMSEEVKKALEQSL